MSLLTNVCYFGAGDVERLSWGENISTYTPVGAVWLTHIANEFFSCPGILLQAKVSWVSVIHDLKFTQKRGNVIITHT